MRLGISMLLVIGLSRLAVFRCADIDPVAAPPPMTHAGEAEFNKVMSEIDPKLTHGMTAVSQGNPLQFPALTDFWCSWELTDRKRKPALLIDDMQVEYLQYVRGIVPPVKLLVDAFRKAGLPIYWSTWWRLGPDDGWFNSMDRFYGPVGAESSRQALYNHDKVHGGDVLPEIAPNTDEELRRVMHKHYSLDMFDERPMDWLVPAGQKTLHDELQALGVDTIVQVGAWTDDCIIATAYHAFGLQYDIVLVEDGVSTASKQHFNAIEVMRGSIAKVLVASKVAEYVNNGLQVIPPSLPKAKSSGSRVALASVVSDEQLASAFAKKPLTPSSAGDGASGPGSASIATIANIAQIFNGSFLALFGFFAGWMARGKTYRRDTPSNPLLA